MKAWPLSEQHRGEVRRAAERALAQWLPAGPPPEPAQVVQGLERVLLFLRQHGSPSRQAAQVASLALAWGEQVVRAAGWSWMNLAEDGAVNPGLVSPAGAHACLPVDLVTVLVLEKKGSLAALYRRLVEGPLPPASAGALVVIDGSLH